MVRFTAVTILLFSSGLCTGADPSAAPASRDDRLLEKLLGEEGEAPSTPEIVQKKAEEAVLLDPAAVGRISDSLFEARRLLSENRTDESTRAAQKAVVDGLNRLLDTAKNADSSPRSERQSSAGSGSSQAGGTEPNESSPTDGDQPTTADGGPQGPPERNRDGKAEESSDRVRDGEAHDFVRDFQSELARDTWGHLPPRLREQLLNAGSDRYLPQYDSLVRRYFESIAQPSTGEPGR